MPHLLLIRHGENDFSRRGRLAGRLRGVHLNERGRAQAEELAESLKTAPIRGLYSSPLDRALETARPIGAAVGIRVKQNSGLLESDVGAWQGKSLRRLALTKPWRVVQLSPSRAAHPGGETFVDTQARIVSALEQIMKQHGTRDLIACVFHADPIKLAISHYLGLPLDYFQRLACDTGSVSLLSITPSTARLGWLNQHPPFDLTGLKRAR